MQGHVQRSVSLSKNPRCLEQGTAGSVSGAAFGRIVSLEMHLSEAFYEALGEVAGMVDLPSRRAVFSPLSDGRTVSCLCLRLVSDFDSDHSRIASDDASSCTSTSMSI